MGWTRTPARGVLRSGHLHAHPFGPPSPSSPPQHDWCSGWVGSAFFAALRVIRRHGWDAQTRIGSVA
eukprot:11416471-Prorocentrum_lima.AAC.1